MRGGARRRGSRGTGACASRIASGATGSAAGGFFAGGASGCPARTEWTPDADAPQEDLDRLTTRVRRAARLWWMVEPPARVYRLEFRTLREAWARCRAGLARRPVPKRDARAFGLSN